MHIISLPLMRRICLCIISFIALASHQINKNRMKVELLTGISQANSKVVEKKKQTSKAIKAKRVESEQKKPKKLRIASHKIIQMKSRRQKVAKVKIIALIASSNSATSKISKNYRNKRNRSRNARLIKRLLYLTKAKQLRKKT